jgi:hypothetical protein
MAKHTWRFARVGGFDQVQINSGQDLVNLAKLDQKLWVALACPVKGIEFDERTLALIDTDHDGRVRASELLAATKWTKKVLGRLDVLEKNSALPLDAIADAQIRESAEAVLESIGKPDAKTISVADTAHAESEFNRRPFNGDGVITTASARDDATKQLVEEVLACSTPIADKSGLPGVDAVQAASFLDAITAHAAWLAEGEADAKTRPFATAPRTRGTPSKPYGRRSKTSSRARRWPRSTRARSAP